MKQFKTALLAGAFVLAAGAAFANTYNDDAGGAPELGVDGGAANWITPAYQALAHHAQVLRGSTVRKTNGSGSVDRGTRSLGDMDRAGH